MVGGLPLVSIELDSTVITAEWILAFKAALGDLGRNAPRANVLGSKVSVSIQLSTIRTRKNRSRRQKTSEST
jgi:hypothetical protein